MTAMDNTAKRSIKFKITSKGIRVESEDKSHENMTVNVNNGNRTKVTGNGNKNSISVEFSMSGNSKKRRPEVILCGEREKRQRMDQSLKQQCGNILQEMMRHPHGSVFNEPVDPVKLKIPDYFAIITEPIDLGTIRHKLEENEYFSAQEFARDVRLTFSNAMLYNPTNNFVHIFAKELNNIFCKRWNLLESKLKCTGRNFKQIFMLDKKEKNGGDTKETTGKKGQNAKQTCLDKAPLRISLVDSSPQMLVEEKQYLRKELVKMLSRKMTENLRSVFQKFGLPKIKEGEIGAYVNEIDDGTLLELKRALKFSLDTKDGKVKSAKTTQSGQPTLGKTAHKDACNRACAVVNRRQPFDLSAIKCATCGNLICQCHLESTPVPPSSSDLPSERSSDYSRCGDSKPDPGAKYPSASHASRLTQDSDGPESVLNDGNSEHGPPPSPPATTASSGEDWASVVNVQMSPRKALRAAMLKSRFAETIFKATHQTLLDHGKKVNSVNMQKERERLERQQREEKAKIEAEIRAAEAASRMKAETELKMKRQRAREAARLALEKMEKTVDIYDNHEIMMDIEMLCRGSSLGFGVGRGGHLGSPLEQLGLSLKGDYMEEEVDEAASWEREEGEILP